MTDILQLAKQNLTSPVVLFFGLGLLLRTIKAKVDFPEAVSNIIIIYLLLGIGIKGGAAIAENELSAVLLPFLAGIFLSGFIALYTFFILWKIGRFTYDNAAAIAGHYGSISVVTFIAATVFLTNAGVSFEAYINGLPAIMEVPGIIVALILASWAKRKVSDQSFQEEISLWRIAKDVVVNKSVVLLLGAIIVGYLSGPEGVKTVSVFYKDLFMGVLTLFMLENGMIAASKLQELKKVGIFLIFFGIIIPVVNAFIGILIGFILGMSMGGATLLGVLSASSSYIVAPAAMRISLPKANPALYLGISMGITLPFNLIFGIPLYSHIAAFLANKLFC